MVCRSTVTLISSGEGYGFSVDRAISDSRVIRVRVRGSGAPRAYSGLSVESRRLGACLPRRPRETATNPIGVVPQPAFFLALFFPGEPQYGQENYLRARQNALLGGLIFEFTRQCISVLLFEDAPESFTRSTAFIMGRDGARVH